MEHNFLFRYSGWEFWTSTSQAKLFPYLLEIFWSVKQKQTYHLHSNRIFRISFVIGKRTLSQERTPNAEAEHGTTNRTQVRCS